MTKKDSLKNKIQEKQARKIKILYAILHMAQVNTCDWLLLILAQKQKGCLSHAQRTEFHPNYSLYATQTETIHTAALKIIKYCFEICILQSIQL